MANPSTPGPASRSRWSLGFVLSLALLVRIPTLGDQSFWGDEAVTRKVLDGPLHDLLPSIAHGESTPPLYYLLAWPWARVVGSGEIALRSLSAGAGVLTVAFAWLAARRLVGERAALVAGVLVALDPLLVWYSQEARSYALLGLFCAMTLWATIRWAQDARGAVVWLLAASLAACTHYFAVLVVVPCLGWVAITRGPARSSVFLVATGLGVVAIPLAVLAMRQRSSGRSDWITGTPLVTRAVRVVEDGLTGLSAPVQGLLALLAASAASGLCALAWRRSDGAEGQALRRGFAPLAVAACGFALALIAALGGLDVVLARNFVGSLVCGLVGLACILGALLDSRPRRLWPPGAVAVTLTGVFIAGTAGAVVDARYRRPDWRAAGRLIAAAPGPAVVALDPPTIGLPLRLYAGRLPPADRVGLRVRSVVFVRFALDTQGARRSDHPFRALHGFRCVVEHVSPTVTVTGCTASQPRRVPAGLHRLFRGT